MDGVLDVWMVGMMDVCVNDDDGYVNVFDDRCVDGCS